MGSTFSADIDSDVSAFRGFNRFYTRVIGLLDEGLVKSGYSLTEARVLFELAHRGKCSASEIAEELNLDAGYLSRILSKFSEARLLARSPLARDARHAVLRLTRKGKTAFADLDRRSAGQAREVLENLFPATRADLIRSMRAIQNALSKREPGPAPFVLRPHRPGDMGWVVQRHGMLYAQEHGWDQQFEALVAHIAADFIQNFDERHERCWIAERNGEAVGSIFLVRHPDREETARLRLLLVEPSARGLGLGKALVAECIQFARMSGYKKMTLWTQSNLPAAHRVYEKAGFKLTAEEPHHSFGRDLVGQTWDLDL